MKKLYRQINLLVVVIFGLCVFLDSCGVKSGDASNRGDNIKQLENNCPGINEDEEPEILALVPSEIESSHEAFELHIYGRFIQSIGNDTKISISGAVTNGKPVNPCHLKVLIPAGYFSRAGEYEVAAVTRSQSLSVKLKVD